MRKVLLVLCIFGITVSVKGQLFSKKWVSGCYYDTSGHRFNGLLFHAQPEASVFKGKGDYLFFKLNKQADQQKIFSDQLKCFVIGTDSFTVTHLPAFGKFPFLQIMLDHENKLYYSAITPSVIPIVGPSIIAAIGSAAAGAALSGPGSSAYYFGPDPEHIALINHKNYIAVMSMLMADKPEVVERIRKKKYPTKSFKELLEYYRTGIIPKESPDDVY